MERLKQCRGMTETERDCPVEKQKPGKDQWQQTRKGVVDTRVFTKDEVFELEDESDMRRDRRWGVEDNYRIWSGYKLEDSKANGPTARRQFYIPARQNPSKS